MRLGGKSMNSILPFNQVQFTSDDIILLDTSFILNSLGYNNNVFLESECNSLIASISMSNAICCIPQIAKTELLHIIKKDIFRRSGYYNENKIKQLKNSNFTLYEQLYDQAKTSTEGYFNTLYNNDIIFPESVGDINELLLELSKKIADDFKLYGTNDSILIATAVKEKINYIASTDKDFCNINIKNLTILMDSDNYNNNYNSNNVQAVREYN
jgi:predicted nucleic acid-binding protein